MRELAKNTIDCAHVNHEMREQSTMELTIEEKQQRGECIRWN